MKEYLAYYEVQVQGATLYLHTIVAANSAEEAGEKFFNQPTREFGDVTLNPKGVCGLLAEKRNKELLREVGAGINSKSFKLPKKGR